MTNRQVLNYIEDWLNKKRIKSYFKGKLRKERYIKMKESDFYRFCNKLVELINNNIE